MIVNENQTNPIDASCRVPLLVLFGGAAAWLVVSSLLALVASLTFHMPEKFGDCSWLTYGHLQPAADDALLYGFCIPAGLGVALWIFARLGQTPLRGALFPSSPRISGILACWSGWSEFSLATARDFSGWNFRAAVQRCSSLRICCWDCGR